MFWEILLSGSRHQICRHLALAGPSYLPHLALAGPANCVNFRPGPHKLDLEWASYSKYLFTIHCSRFWF